MYRQSSFLSFDRLNRKWNQTKITNHESCHSSHLFGADVPDKLGAPARLKGSDEIKRIHVPCILIVVERWTRAEDMNFGHKVSTPFGYWEYCALHVKLFDSVDGGWIHLKNAGLLIVMHLIRSNEESTGVCRFKAQRILR